MKYDAARLEVQRIEWARYRAPASAGPSIPEIFNGLFDAASQDEAIGFSLEQRFEVQSMVYEVALPAIDVILLAYADSPPLWLEMELLNTMHNILMGEPHRSELKFGNELLMEECHYRARCGMWVMYGRLSRHNHGFLLDILAELDHETARVEAFKAKFSNQ